MTSKTHDPLADYRLQDGTLTTYADGGYPLYYLDGQDSILCPRCANKAEQEEEDPPIIPQFLPVAVGINYEDPHLLCDQCSQHIPSAYADDEEEKDEGVEEEGRAKEESRYVPHT